MEKMKEKLNWIDIDVIKQKDLNDQWENHLFPNGGARQADPQSSLQMSFSIKSQKEAETDPISRSVLSILGWRYSYNTLSLQALGWMCFMTTIRCEAQG